MSYCADCHRTNCVFYTITRPDGTTFRMCDRCWDRMVGAALQTFIR